MTQVRGVAVALVFLVGCAVGGVAGRVAIPSAGAQQAAGLTKWEYTCLVGRTEEGTTKKANEVGQQGWELASASGVLWCFKRPLR